MKIKDYKVRPLKFDDKLVKTVMTRRGKGESIAAIAKALEVGGGKAAPLCQRQVRRP